MAKADIIVIGGGAAGMTAALYALRSGKSVLLLESDNIGGQIAFSPRVENFPSIKQISGSELADNLMEQITALGAQIELERVQSVQKTDNGFEVVTDFGAHTGGAVIIAAGVKHKHIGIEGELDLVGKGVSYCAVCDGAFYAGEEVALVGDGNTALQYSILLSNYCKKVYVCTWFDKFFGDYALVKCLRERPNVEVIPNVCLKEFVTDGAGDLKGLKFVGRETGEPLNLDVKAVFIAIGQVPDNKAFANLAKLDKDGYIIAGEDCRTDTPGVFAAGDCRTKKIRQLTTACADGATAAIAACQYLDSLCCQ
ncbi:MAG: FAD-dependent oxidoreductase [Clostridiales bacterium]|jgi:thioredoxin reductase (NADPH)|nr:FAD-dependent oxidoreductase [Clostridiales bacterium]HOK82275.1 FAD-dependent oxidoreductase [Clostridia bacterium]HOL61118.1 FAD-dependent oxidoreductase [Clostridia bacterium]HPO53748.1 FAD-dependent oxidoreductase [Clostridia bacterium]